MYKVSTKTVVSIKNVSLNGAQQEIGLSGVLTDSLEECTLPEVKSARFITSLE